MTNSETQPPAPEPSAIRPAPEAALALFHRYFLNREDRVAILPAWSRPCPAEPCGDLDALLLGHVQGDAAPSAKVAYQTRKRGGAMVGRFRVGSYAPGPDNTTKWLCIDLDGSGHAHALVDPGATALATLAAFREVGIPAYLERSGGGHGWHVWVFFTEPVPAAHARALGHALVPKDARLSGPAQAFADAKRGRGIEVFPKQDRLSRGRYGNLLWLPWWRDAPDGANLFYRVEADDALTPFVPEGFDTADPELVERLVAIYSVTPPKPTTVAARASSASADIWTTWRADALAALPLESIYSAWLTGNTSGRGWLECRDPSSGSGDQNPSAGVADGTGDAERGAFHSFISGKTLSVFDFLVEQGEAKDFAAARALVAERAHVELPQPTSGLPPRLPSRYVLIPGEHIDNFKVRHEVGTHLFVSTVLARLPVGVLYRRDFVVGEIVGEPGARRFVAVTEHRMRALVDRHVKLGRWTRNQQGDIFQVFVACSRDHAGLLLAAAGASELIAELRLLVHHPVYLPDLSLARPGWNEESGVYYDEPPGLEGLEPRAGGAADVLRDLVVDFPFADEASRQNVFGAMATLLLRPAIAGKVPFHLTMAPLERTGKGKLTDTAIGEAVLGHAIAPMQPGRTEEEREKRITSLLLQGETVVHLDNLPIGDVLDSPALASLATSWPHWRGRLLGVSRVPLLPNNLVVFLSGNNPKTTGEIAKRMVPVTLQPKDARPEERTDFVHPDAEGYARGRRRVVLEALIGMVEAWKAAGRPAPRVRRAMGGFERWVEIIGGVLGHAGLTEWMANYRGWVRGADEWSGDAEVLVEHWAKRHGAAPVQAKDVLAMIAELGIFPAVTGRPSEQAQWSALGKRVLVPLLKRPVLRWQIETEGRGGSKRYRLRELVPRGPVSVAAAPSGLLDPEGSEGSEGFHLDPRSEHGATDAHMGTQWERLGNPSDLSDPSGNGRGEVADKQVRAPADVIDLATFDFGEDGAADPGLLDGDLDLDRLFGTPSGRTA